MVMDEKVTKERKMSGTSLSALRSFTGGGNHRR
jgi:hypothetical protein